LFQCTVALAQPPGYGFGKQVVIDAAQVSGLAPLTNFPVLVSITDPDLRTVGNGGRVENPNGFDILFTLSDCSTVLAHDLEQYNPITGELVVWVQVPVLDNLVNTFLFMYYGNNTIVTDLSTNTVWTDVGYDGVWHLHDDFLDASGSGNDGTNNGSTDLSPANNSADGQNFVDPNHWIELANHPTRTGSFSYSGWVRTINNGTSGQRIICDDETNGNGCHALSIGDPGAGRIRFYIRGLAPVSLDSPAGTISNNTWHYVVGTYDAAANFRSLYVDGVLINSGAVTGTLGAAAGNASIGGEVAAGEAGNRLNGDLDEIRASNTVLSADWVATEYNNQNSPASFYSFSLELDATSLCLTLPIQLIYFQAYPTEENTVKLEWKTASEVNNDFFTIERSSDGVEWKEIKRIDGAGNAEMMTYTVLDEKPLAGLSYYRLKQTDFNGEFEYVDVKSVNFENTQLIHVYPNPTRNQFIIEGENEELQSLMISNILGENIVSGIKKEFINDRMMRVNISHLPNGVYLLKTKSTINKVYKE